MNALPFLFDQPYPGKEVISCVNEEKAVPMSSFDVEITVALVCVPSPVEGLLCVELLAGVW